MYEINKQAFGSFVATLRREKGYTQKELAELLYISNKAVSKWETGVSLPDVSMLIPLSEALDVSVTELLQCRRNTAPLIPEQVENLVKTAIAYSWEGPQREFKRRRILVYTACVLLALCEAAFLYLQGGVFTESLTGAILMGILAGFYFMIAVQTKLPDYYDSNRITTYNDGPVRMNLGAIPINNRNWPHIVKVYRWWSMLFLILYPLTNLLMQTLAPDFWMAYEKFFFLIAILGGVLVPVMYVGKKYQ